MLTNVHTFIIKELLTREGVKNIDPDIYMYNIAPDSLPLHKDITEELTHNVDFSNKAFYLYPKLIYIKYHILVDNFFHYGVLHKEDEKKGFTYIKAKYLIDNVKGLYQSLNRNINDAEILYIAHTIVELATDLQLFKDDKEPIRLFFNAAASLTDKKLEEYSEALACLYNLSKEKIKEAREEPIKFYGSFSSPEEFLLNKRARLILRKANCAYTNENIDKVKEVIIAAEEIITDYKLYLLMCIDELERYNKMSKINLLD